MSDNSGFWTLSWFQHSCKSQRIHYRLWRLTSDPLKIRFCWPWVVEVHICCTDLDMSGHVQQILLQGVFLCAKDLKIFNQRSGFSIGLKLLFKDINTCRTKYTCGGAPGTDWLPGATGTTSGWTPCIWGWTLCTTERQKQHMVKMRQRRKQTCSKKIK